MNHVYDIARGTIKWALVVKQIYPEAGLNEMKVIVGPRIDAIESNLIRQSVKYLASAYLSRSNCILDGKLVFR